MVKATTPATGEGILPFLERPGPDYLTEEILKDKYGAFLLGVMICIPMTWIWVHDSLSRLEIFYPTQTCHTDVKHYLEAHHEPGIRVASGICKDRVGYVYKHTWIEEGGNVISWGILHDKRAQFVMPREDFYSVMNVSSATYQTP